jgi:hypothetical protein
MEGDRSPVGAPGPLILYVVALASRPAAGRSESAESGIAA